MLFCFTESSEESLMRKGAVVLLIVAVLGTAAYAVILLARIDELDSSNTDLQDRLNRCRSEQQGLIQNFEKTIGRMNEEFEKLQEQLSACREERR